MKKKSKIIFMISLFLITILFLRHGLYITRDNDLIHVQGATIKTRFLTPEGYERQKYPEESFQEFLRNYPLQPHGTLVKYYNGRSKPGYHIYHAVFDQEIGDKDLHQCADAIIRLRAEYLYQNNRIEDIHFNLTNGFTVPYSKWLDGYRIKVSGNKTEWYYYKNTDDNLETFTKYLEFIYIYAGSISLSKELKSIDIHDLDIGDVFIQGGSPGHAVIVVDLAVNAEGNKIFILAQSYMPAQQTQVLQNPNNAKISPWYELRNIRNTLKTPEWTFRVSDVKEF